MREIERSKELIVETLKSNGFRRFEEDWIEAWNSKEYILTFFDAYGVEISV